jgi:hypothetical protein
MNPWLAVLNNPPAVTREEIEKVRKAKEQLKPSKRYNLPMKYLDQ